MTTENKCVIRNVIFAVRQMLPKLEYCNISRKTQARSYCENRTSEICDINSSARKFLQINYNKSMKTYSSWNMYILWLYSVELRDLLPMPNCPTMRYYTGSV